MNTEAPFSIYCRYVRAILKLQSDILWGVPFSVFETSCIHESILSRSSKYKQHLREIGADITTIKVTVRDQSADEILTYILDGVKSELIDGEDCNFILDEDKATYLASLDEMFVRLAVDATAMNGNECDEKSLLINALKQHNRKTAKEWLAEVDEINNRADSIRAKAVMARHKKH